jgi:hypothetical protein
LAIGIPDTEFDSFLRDCPCDADGVPFHGRRLTSHDSFGSIPADDAIFVSIRIALAYPSFFTMSTMDELFACFSGLGSLF